MGITLSTQHNWSWFLVNKTLYSVVQMNKPKTPFCQPLYSCVMSLLSIQVTQTKCKIWEEPEELCCHCHWQAKHHCSYHKNSNILSLVHVCTGALHVSGSSAGLQLGSTTSPHRPVCRVLPSAAECCIVLPRAQCSPALTWGNPALSSRGTMGQWQCSDR